MVGIGFLSSSLGSTITALTFLGFECLAPHVWNFIELLGFEDFSSLELTCSAGWPSCVSAHHFIGWPTRLVTAPTLSLFILTSFMLVVHKLIGHPPTIGVGLILINLDVSYKLHILTHKTLRIEMRQAKK